MPDYTFGIEQTDWTPLETSAGPYCLAAEFTSDMAGDVGGMWFYKVANDLLTAHIFTLWAGDGTKLAEKTSSGEASGPRWIYQAFDSACTISAGTTYVASVGGNTTRYGYTAGNFWSWLWGPLRRVRGGYANSAGSAFPTTFAAYIYRGISPKITTSSPWPGYLVNNGTRQRGVVGALRGVNIGLATLWTGDGYARHLQTGVRRAIEYGGSSLALDYPGMWRFRWGVEPGERTISIRAKQVSNVAGKRPRLTVTANPEIGVMADVNGDAPAGADWVTIGPVTVYPDAKGVLWVELWNRDTDTFESPAFFDHATAT